MNKRKIEKIGIRILLVFFLISFVSIYHTKILVDDNYRDLVNWLYDNSQMDTKMRMIQKQTDLCNSTESGDDVFIRKCDKLIEAIDLEGQIKASKDLSIFIVDLQFRSTESRYYQEQNVIQDRIIGVLILISILIVVLTLRSFVIKEDLRSYFKSLRKILLYAGLLLFISWVIGVLIKIIIHPSPMEYLYGYTTSEIPVIPVHLWLFSAITSHYLPVSLFFIGFFLMGKFIELKIPADKKKATKP